MKIYRLEEMPASSEQYYSNDMLVRYVGVTTSDYIANRLYKATYDETTEVYGWEEAVEYEYFIKVFTRSNLIYMLTELTNRLRGIE